MPPTSSPCNSTSPVCYSAPQPDADAGQFLPERSRTVDRPTGPVDGGQDAVAGPLDQPAAGLLDATDAGDESLDVVKGELRRLPEQRQLGPW